jgi:beta-lactamase domain protein
VSVGLVAGEQRAALIDCGSTPEQGAALLERARDLVEVPVSHVVVTHPHHDHWFGLAGMAEVTSIAHEDLLRDPEAEVLDAAAAIGLSRLPAPDETFSLARSLDLGGVRLEMLHLGPAHTRADIVVVVPGEDVIFMGDLIESAGDPQFGPASDVGSWPKVLDDALGASTEATRFVPGHALVGGEELTVDREFCFRQRAEIAMVQGTIEGLVYRGVTLENALGSADWPFDEDTMRVALPLAYRRLAEKGVEPRRHLPLV